MQDWGKERRREERERGWGREKGGEERKRQRKKEKEKKGWEKSALTSPQKQLCYAVKLFSQAITNNYIHSSISEPFTEHEPLTLPTSSVAKRETKRRRKACSDAEQVSGRAGKTTQVY